MRKTPWAYLEKALPRANTEFGAVTLMGLTTGTEEIARLTMETASPLGRIRHLRPVAILGETPAHWTQPPVPLGYDRPEWTEI